MAFITRRFGLSYDIVNAAYAGDENVQVRRGKTQTGYFRLNQSSQLGTMVIQERNGYIGEPAEVSLDDLEQMKLD